jgi:NitT/TauT family transport system permease protein
VIRHPIQHTTALLLGVASVVILLGAYTLLAHWQHRTNPDDTTIPTWSQLKDGVVIAVGLNKRSNERWLVEDAKASGARLFLGLSTAVAGSLALGMLMGCLTPVEAFCFPPLSLLAKIPPTAALAVFFVLVGTGENMYVTMIAFGVLPTLTMTVYLAVKEFPEELQYKAYTLGASHLEVIWTIMFRHVLPKLIDAVRLVIGPAMVYLIAAEMVVGDVGFGYRIRLQSKLLNMSVVYPYLAFLAAFGFAADYLLRLLQRKWCPWFEGRRD